MAYVLDFVFLPTLLYTISGFIDGMFVKFYIDSESSQTGYGNITMAALKNNIIPFGPVVDQTLFIYQLLIIRLE